MKLLSKEEEDFLIVQDLNLKAISSRQNVRLIADLLDLYIDRIILPIEFEFFSVPALTKKNFSIDEVLTCLSYPRYSYHFIMKTFNWSTDKFPVKRVLKLLDLSYFDLSTPFNKSITWQERFDNYEAMKRHMCYFLVSCYFPRKIRADELFGFPKIAVGVDLLSLHSIKNTKTHRLDFYHLYLADELSRRSLPYLSPVLFVKEYNLDQLNKFFKELYSDVISNCMSQIDEYHEQFRRFYRRPFGEEFPYPSRFDLKGGLL